MLLDFLHLTDICISFILYMNWFLCLKQSTESTDIMFKARDDNTAFILKMRIGNVKCRLKFLTWNSPDSCFATVEVAPKRDQRASFASEDWGRKTIRLDMKLLPVLVTLVLTLALAYYVYTPVPDAIQEPWKLMAVHTMLRTTRHLVRHSIPFENGAMSETVGCTLQVCNSVMIRGQSAPNLNFLCADI